VHEISTRLRQGLQNLGFQTGLSESHIVPLIVGSDSEALRLADYLLSNGFLAPAIRAPTVPVGQARIRLSVTAAHSTEQVDELLFTLSQGAV
jgi:8-amino-7-oxononanoate synthase